MTNDCPVALVHQSATRRKSCSGCVKAKRRCDLILPMCSRCSLRNLRCIYINGEVSGTNSSETFPFTNGLSTNSSPTAIALSTSATLDAGTHPIGSTDSDRLDPLLEMANSIDSMTSFDVPFRSFAFPERGLLTNRQFHYMVAQFKNCIKLFVTDNQTPFIHPLLYQETIPQVYQDAMGVCSLYIQKTPRNRNAMFQMLDCKLVTLVQDSTSLLCRVKDNLLALQALILYQFIRLFDGDVRQRANAERHLVLLDSWTLRLHQNYSQVLTTPEKETSYSHWVLVESIRRTTMVSVLLRGLYFVMTDGYCQLVPLMCSLPVSNKALLWKIPETEWGNQNISNDGEVLTYVEWSRQWNAGNINSVDEYEKLLLVTCRYATGTGNFKVGSTDNTG